MYLLDTDILIFALKGHTVVRSKLERHEMDAMAISVVSLMELYYGAHKSQNVEANLAKVRTLETAFDIVPAGAEIAVSFGSFKARLQALGTPLDDFDLILAASALSFNLVLVTNNTRHFKRIDGLKIENWAVG